eukprot:scaffold4633_cov114-Isochrysis_galbana.AAC.6
MQRDGRRPRRSRPRRCDGARFTAEEFRAAGQVLHEQRVVLAPLNNESGLARAARLLGQDDLVPEAGNGAGRASAGSAGHRRCATRRQTQSQLS